MKIKSMKKKLLAMLLIVLMCVPLSGPMTANAASSAYRNWAQWDSDWGSIHLGKSQYTMKSSGCLVTAIAMLICHTGSADASSFNPGTLVTYLNNNGGFTSDGSLYWGKVSGAADSFTLYNSRVSLANMTKAQKIAKMAEYVKDGYGVIISVRNGGHWVALDRIEGSTVYMLDPGDSNTDLFATYSESGVDRLAIYKGKYAGGSVSGDTGSDSNNNTSSDKVIGTGTVNCSSLYVRSGAGTNNSVVTSITRNTKVDILGEAKDSKGTKWYKVKVNGKTGYACADYITVAGSDSNNSNNSSNTETASGSGTVNCSSLNVRSGAGTNNSVVTTVSRNQAVTITGTAKDSSGSKWYAVTFSKSGKSYKGYVSAQYITLKSSNDNNASDNNTSDNTTSIAAVVNCDALNMRSGAGTGNSVVATLTRNTAVTITGEAKDSSGTVWYKITVNGKTGYVHSSYLTKKNSSDNSNNSSSDTSTDMSGKTMKVAYDAVNVRSGAGTSKGVVTVVYQNEKVTVTGQAKDSSGNTWYQIKTSSGKTGYIRSDLVKADSSDSSSKSDSNSSNSGTSSDLNGQTMKVAYDGVNMRSGAGTSKGVIEVIYLEDTLTVAGQDKDSSGNVWYKVKAKSGNTGYIRSDMLKKADSSSASSTSNSNQSSNTPSDGRVTDGWLNVRNGAGTSNKVLVVISEGTKVSISESVKDSSGSLWYHITVNYGGTNYDGYVSAQYIK